MKKDQGCSLGLLLVQMNCSSFVMNCNRYTSKPAHQETMDFSEQAFDDIPKYPKLLVEKQEAS